MDFDYGVLIGLVGTGLLAGIIGLSYAGAYLIGRARGQRDAERQRRLEERTVAQAGTADRMMVVESAIESLARAVERMTDAQRVALLQGNRQEREALRAPELRAPVRAGANNTPST